MLVTMRDRIQDAIARGLSADQLVASNPARRYVEPDARTEGWLRAAYEEYR